MAGPRPTRVGNYELLEDYETEQATVRVLRMARTAQAVQRHLHNHCTQIYVVLEGQIRVHVDGTETEITPYQAKVIPPGAVHGASPVGEAAVLMNLSIPPLRADDQVPVPVLEGSQP